ncbi:hypothetical protein [Sutterella wadsworthensis]
MMIVISAGVSRRKR